MTDNAEDPPDPTPGDSDTDDLPTDAEAALAARAREVRSADPDDLTPLDDL